MRYLQMSRKELNRKRDLEEVKAGRLCLKECALRVGLSYRQTRRVYRRFCQEGDAGLVHRSHTTHTNGVQLASVCAMSTSHVVTAAAHTDLRPHAQLEGQ